MDTANLKPATAARMYDYYLGGIHNFPADRAAADEVIAQFPDITVTARANRAFVRRVVRELIGAGVRQFLDLGSGIPTVVNVHEVAQNAAPRTRVVYVDLDPLAVAESHEILAGNAHATAIRGDLRDPEAVLAHPEVRRILDFHQPVAVLLNAVLHFVPDNDLATSIVDTFMAAVPAGSYLSISHAADEAFPPQGAERGDNVYRRQTATPAVSRNHDEVSRLFAGLKVLEPGVVWLPEWRPAGDPDGPEYASPPEAVQTPRRSGCWCAIGQKP